MRRIAFIAAGLLLLPPSFAVAQNAGNYGKPETSVASGNRYRKEIVFPLEMDNLSVGISPYIMRDFMVHSSVPADITVTLPPVHIAYERCVWDMGNAGSIGTGLFLSYGKYKYSYAGDDGRGGDTIDVKAGLVNMLAGLSYHYTIRTRLEVYARLMIGSSMGNFDSGRASGVDSWRPRFIWNGVAGVRYFFSNSFGVYAEGGYTSGYVNLGATLRW